MKQALHIFRKDVGHLGPELSVSLGLMVVFVFVAPQAWIGADGVNQAAGMFAPVMKLMIPLMWLVMIARVVQEENMVGDQQFWVTRPYSWRSLLGAKVLFVVVCLALPMVLMETVLVMRAGISPFADWKGMIVTCGAMAMMMWFPFFAISAVTVNPTRAFMALIGAGAAWAVVMMVFSGSTGRRMSAPYSVGAIAVVCGALIAGTVLYVYMTRDVFGSRWTLVGTGLCFLVLLGCSLGLYLGGAANVLVRTDYPAVASSPLKLVFHPDASGADANDDDGGGSGGNWVLVHVPAVVEGLAAQDRLGDTNASYTLDAPGYHYESPWRPVVPGERGMALVVPKSVYLRLQSGEVRMHLSLVAAMLTPGTPQIVTAQEHFNVPDHGRCLLLDSPIQNMVCQYAYESPLPTRVMGLVGEGMCGLAKRTHVAGASLMEQPPGIRVDPVIEETLQFNGSVCPGTELTFVSYHAAGNYRMELEIAAIVLKDYRMA